MLKTLKQLRKIPNDVPGKGFYEANRNKVVEKFRELSKITHGYLLFKGPIEQPVYDDDNEFLPIGEANFSYLFGVEEPHTWGLIDIATSESVLLIKVSDPNRSYWMKTKTLKEFEEEFEVDSVRNIEALGEVIGLTLENKQDYDKKMYIMSGVNQETNSLLHTPNSEEIGQFSGHLLTPSLELYNALIQSRKDKFSAELHLLRQAADITGNVLSSLMAYVTEGSSELGLGHHFQAIALYFGSFYPSFTPIIAFGKNKLKGFHNSSCGSLAKNGELGIFEVGVRFFGYCSKLIRTIPVSGIFSDYQRSIYERLIALYQSFLNEIKFGATYVSLDGFLEREIANFFIQIGLATCSIDELIDKQIVKRFYDPAFMRYIGLDISEPLTVEFWKGEIGSEINTNCSIFVNFSLVFDFETLENLEGLDQKVLQTISSEIGAVKLGDVVTICEKINSTFTFAFPFEASAIEKLIKEIRCKE